MGQYILLGIVQGLTEFLPVSSSGHLAILQHFFGITEGVVALDIVLHLGTTLSLVIFFFKDIIAIARSKKLLALLALATIITGIIAIAGKDFFESSFSSPKYLAAGFIITGVLLLATRGFMKGTREQLNTLDSVCMGIAQAVAIVPSISRSGCTVVSLLFRGVDRDLSFRFSFIAAIPVIVGAALLKMKDISSLAGLGGQALAVGFVCSAAAGLLSLWLLKQVIHKAKLHYFSYYCFALAVILLLFVR
jgi:undecaprenyl-diphosphatase